MFRRSAFSRGNNKTLKYTEYIKKIKFRPMLTLRDNYVLRKSEGPVLTIDNTTYKE